MSFIKNAIEKVDQSKVALEEQKDAVRALEELGKAKAEIFIRDIQTSLLTAGEEKSNKTVPVTFLVASKREVRAFSSSEVGNIGGVVTSALTSFLSGDKKRVISGVGSAITDLMTIFLGAGNASSDTIEMYFVATDGLSPVRIDIKAWYYSATATSIKTSLEKVTTIVATKSVIDVTKIDLGTFLYLFSSQINSDNMSPEELDKAINEAADVYNTFVNRSSIKKTIPQQRAPMPNYIKEQYAETIAKMVHVEDKQTVINNPLNL